jgi:hypothetical protein
MYAITTAQGNLRLRHGYVCSFTPTNLTMNSHLQTVHALPDGFQYQHAFSDPNRYVQGIIQESMCSFTGSLIEQLMFLKRAITSRFNCQIKLRQTVITSSLTVPCILSRIDGIWCLDIKKIVDLLRNALLVSKELECYSHNYFKLKFIKFL